MVGASWRAPAFRVAIAGLLGAAAFALFSMVWFAIGGTGFWRPLNLIGHTVWHGAPVDGGLHWSVLLGLATLAVVGVVAIVPFALVALGSGLTGLFLIVAAAIYANIIWVFGHYLIWERVDPFAAHAFSPGVAWLTHAVAGAVAGAALVALRPLESPGKHERNW